MGALDFAGGTVVHISSGISALAAAMVYGARRGYARENMMPHNLPFSVIGAVAGLVSITPAAGFVSPVSAIIIGAGGVVLCYAACNLKARLGYDDSLDVVGVHGVGGIWGALATGLFASTLVNSGGADGLFFGNPGQLWIQFVGVAATMVFAFVGTLIILGILNATMGLRVSDDEEQMGLDLSQHEERGYTW